MRLYKELELPKGGGRQTPKRIVVHAMGEFIKPSRNDKHMWPALDWLRFCGLSAHALIYPSGVIAEPRAADLIAWHAKGHNTDTIGFEVLVPGIHDYDSLCAAMRIEDWPSNAQYSAAAGLVSAWRSNWDIPREEVYRHSTLDPSRREDPGKGFTMEYII